MHEVVVDRVPVLDEEAEDRDQVLCDVGHRDDEQRQEAAARVGHEDSAEDDHDQDDREDQITLVVH